MPSEIAMKIAKAIAPSLPDLMYQMATAEPKNTAYLVVQEQLAELIDTAADIPALEARVGELAKLAAQQGSHLDRVCNERDTLAKRLEAVEALHYDIGRGAMCGGCGRYEWPCPTVRLARGES